MKIIKSLFLFAVLFIYPSLKAQLTFTINNLNSSYSITCSHPTVNLIAISNYSATVSYTWTSPQLVSTTANSLGIINPGTYTISGAAGSLTASQTLAIGINTTAPSMTLTSNLNVVTCSTPTVLLQASSTQSVTYIWSTSLGPISGSALGTGVPGIYHVTAQDINNGCVSEGTLNIGDNRIFPVISAPPPFLVTCPDGTVTISPVVPVISNNVNLAFLWTSPATASVMGVTTISLVTNAPGVYVVTGTDTLNGCISKAYISVYACVGLNEFDLESHFKLFPNPVEDKIHFEFDKGLAEELKLSISNTLGQIVYSKSNIDLKEELDVSFLKSGIYYLKLRNDNKQKIFKLIKN